MSIPINPRGDDLDDNSFGLLNIVCACADYCTFERCLKKICEEVMSHDDNQLLIA
jgi:hypothetical protein